MDNANKKTEYINDYECLDCEYYYSEVTSDSKASAACPICFTESEPYYSAIAPLGSLDNE